MPDVYLENNSIGKEKNKQNSSLVSDDRKDFNLNRQN